MSGKTWIVLAGVTGALGVAIGAFGAHVLPGWLESSHVLPEDIARRMVTFEIGVRYHMFHALALLGVGLWSRCASSRAAMVSGITFLLGIIIFSGLLYTIAITGIKFLGMIVPLGGVLWIVGWLALAYSGLVTKPNGVHADGD